METFIHVPADLIYEGLLPVPLLRQTIISQFFAQELHFILSPSLRPHACTQDSTRAELIDVTSFGEIEEFLTENEDIVPQKLKIITNQDFRSMEILLEQFRRQILQVPKLELYIGKYEPTDDELDILLGLPNLSKLQISEVKLKSQKRLSTSFETNQNLRELVFLGHRIADWSNITLPPRLENLDISWFPGTDVMSIKVPQYLQALYLNGGGLSSTTLNQLTFPKNLKTLMLTYNQLETVNVSQLPRTLETIDLSCNRIKTFTFDPRDASWPENLKSILLHENFIDDHTMKQLTKIAWPRDLRDLRLDRNHFTSLEHFRSLPSSIKYLNLSETKLTSFHVSHNDDLYAYFVFPGSLEQLDMLNCRFLRLEGFASVVCMEDRIRFPENLEELNLSGCKLRRLAYFLFPPSLKSMSLTENLIEDLNSYNLDTSSGEVVNWENLHNLSELELFFNHITLLRGWVPPPRLRKLDLGENKLQLVTAENTPLFSAAYEDTTKNLHFLSLERNAIKSIERGAFIPRNIQILNLSCNYLSEFVFTETFLSHRRLSDLDLGYNVIEKILIQRDGESLGAKASLKKLNLSHNVCQSFQMSTAEFYDTLEEVGLVVKKRKHKIESEHHFR